MMAHGLAESGFTFRLPGSLMSLVKSVVTAVSISTQFGFIIILPRFVL
jgi:hypothetical protein